MKRITEFVQANICLTCFLLVIRISKQGDPLSPLLFKFALEYVIRRVQVNQDGFKLNGTLQIWLMLMMLIYWAEAYVL